jgi:hypothetical protein
MGAKGAIVGPLLPPRLSAKAMPRCGRRGPRRAQRLERVDERAQLSKPPQSPS